LTELTIVVPCDETAEIVVSSLVQNYELYKTYPVIVVNKRGGEPFRQLANARIFDQDTPFWFARRFAYEFVKTPFTLNLDVDTVLPKDYVHEALELLKTPRAKVGAVGLDYAEPYNQSHIAFGTSLWRTELLRRLYLWRLTPDQEKTCECLFMWTQAVNAGYEVETFPEPAKHLKAWPEIMRGTIHG
jgi:hypothetical protein